MSDYGVKPVYEKIEFCRNAKTLWGKIQSGRWDWLGVHPNGQFVLGSPRQGKGFTMMAAPTIGRGDATPGEHGVYVRTPLGLGPSKTWCQTEQHAREEFRTTVDSLRDESKGPGLFKVERVEKGSVVDEEWIVRRPPTYR
jgi:hypothetical protein